MAADHPPRYYRVRKGRAFWEPGRFGAEYGLPASQPLGADGAGAKSQALEWNEKLDGARKEKREGKPKRSRYPKGALGAFYEGFQGTEAWAQMEHRTREDYARAWPHIEKRFGAMRVEAITAGDSESFHVEIHPAHRNRRDPDGRKKLTENEAHRVLKVWRALLNALVDYDVRRAAPIGRVTNPAPRGRDRVWLHSEVMKLAEAACWGGHFGMAIAIRLAWDAMLSPEDTWALPISGWRYSEAGGEVSTARAKTAKAVLHAVSDDTARLVEDYLALLRAEGADLSGHLPLVRQRRRRVHRNVWLPFPQRHRFGIAFRAVREAAFPGDDRQFLDLRRSAMTEARMGGATKDDLGAAAANRVDKDTRLEATYLRAASRRVLETRQSGRAPMAAKFSD